MFYVELNWRAIIFTFENEFLKNPTINEYLRGLISSTIASYIICLNNGMSLIDYFIRIHLTVGAMRELLQGLKLYSEDSNLKKIDVMYLENLQRK